MVAVQRKRRGNTDQSLTSSRGTGSPGGHMQALGDLVEAGRGGGKGQGGRRQLGGVAVQPGGERHREGHAQPHPNPRSGPWPPKVAGEGVRAGNPSVDACCHTGQGAPAHPKPLLRGDEAAVVLSPGEVEPRRGEPGLRGAHRDGLGILGEVDIAQHDRPTGVALCGERRGGQPGGVGAAHRHAREHSGLAGMGRHQHPPAAVQGRAEHRSAVGGLHRRRRRAGPGHLRGVHPELDHRAAGEAAGRRCRPRCAPRGRPSWPTSQPRAAATDPRAHGRRRTSPRPAHSTRRRVTARSGVERVQQRGSGEVRRLGVPARAAQPGLRLPRTGGLREDEHASAARSSQDPAKSGVARAYRSPNPRPSTGPPARAR